MGAEGLKNVSVNAVINANYLMNALKGTYRLAIDRMCKHEFVLGGVEMTTELPRWTLQSVSSTMVSIRRRCTSR